MHVIWDGDLREIISPTHMLLMKASSSYVIALDSYRSRTSRLSISSLVFASSSAVAAVLPSVATLTVVLATVSLSVVVYGRGCQYYLTLPLP